MVGSGSSFVNSLDVIPGFLAGIYYFLCHPSGF